MRTSTAERAYSDHSWHNREAELVKWYKKNPRLISEPTLRQQLFNRDNTPTRILEALGGVNWFETRRYTEKTGERKLRKCRKCEKREPAVKLAQCARCKEAWYW